MTTRILITLSLTFAFALSHAAGENIEVISLLHEASQNIDKHSNYEKITESLYSQIRPRANITNKQLSEKQIDESVRKYITEKYVPALLGNYSVIYSELQKHNKSFSNCDNIAPIDEEEENILKAFCLSKIEEVIKVQYMTNGYGKGWSKTLGFVFTAAVGKLELVSIELPLKEGSKAYVEGI